MHVCMYVNKLHTHTHAYTQRYVCVWPRPNPLASVSQATETRVNCVPSHDAAPDRLAPVNFLHQDEAGSRLSAAAAGGQRPIDLRPHAARAIHSSAETCVCVCVCVCVSRCVCVCVFVAFLPHPDRIRIQRNVRGNARVRGRGTPTPACSIYICSISTHLAHTPS